MDISGIYPPIVTPFDVAEHIDWVALEKNINIWNKIPFRGYVVQGSNGEYAYMEKEERLQLVKKVKECMSENKLLIAGSGCESTRSTVELTNEMAGEGADAALVVTPCFYKSGMNDAALMSHYTRVADESKIPIILYNVPPNTGIDLNSEVAKLIAYLRSFLQLILLYIHILCIIRTVLVHVVHVMLRFCTLYIEEEYFFIFVKF